MKIVGIDRGKIIITIGDKSLTVTGELAATPIFYADINSIRYWNYPFNTIEITKDEREKIILDVTEQTKNTEIKILFD